MHRNCILINSISTQISETSLFRDRFDLIRTLLGRDFVTRNDIPITYA